MGGCQQVRNGENIQDEECPADLVNYALMSRWQIGPV
jgi:hypothetical protein